MCAENGERFAGDNLQSCTTNSKCVAFPLLSVPSILLCQVWWKFPSGQACQKRVILSPNSCSRVPASCWTKQTVCAAPAPHRSLQLPVAVLFRAVLPRVLELVLAHWAPCVWKVRSAWREAASNTGPTVCARFLSACFLKRHRLHKVIIITERCLFRNISIDGMSIQIINPKKRKKDRAV